MAAADLLTALQSGVIPPGLVYVQLDTPLGQAIVDPFAAAQDSTTQSIMQALGVHVTLGLGPAPVPAAETPMLAENLTAIGVVGVGLLALWLMTRGRPARSRAAW
jgi:hypothetical protein